MKLLQDTSRQSGMTVLVITHNQSLIPMGQRVIRIKNGQVASIETNDHPVDVEDLEW